MNAETTFPENLVDAVRYFSDPETCFRFAVSMRWPDGVTCPRCGCENVGFVATRKIWNCKGCKKQFSVKVGTIFEDSPLGLDKWFVAIWLLTGAKNGISSHELERALGISQKSTWFMLHRIREALKNGTLDKMSGTVEVDETFVGGLEKNKHKDKKQNKGRGGVGKQVVLGVLNRAEKEGKLSQIRIAVIPDTTQKTLHAEINRNVTHGTDVFTDAHRGYNGLNENYKHAFVDHALRYVEGRVSTNGVENFWSLLDRSVHGTWIKPEPQHLLRYVDEQAYRFNERGGTDLTRFLNAVRKISGKRLTWEQLTQSHLQFMAPK